MLPRCQHGHLIKNDPCRLIYLNAWSGTPASGIIKWCGLPPWNKCVTVEGLWSSKCSRQACCFSVFLLPSDPHVELTAAFPGPSLPEGLHASSHEDYGLNKPLNEKSKAQLNTFLYKLPWPLCLFISSTKYFNQDSYDLSKLSIILSLLMLWLWWL